MTRGRLEIDALRTADASFEAGAAAAFHHDEITTQMVSGILRPGLTLDTVAHQLQELGRQHPDAPWVRVTATPGDLIRISRAIRPIGGGWPARDAAVRKGAAPRDAGFWPGLGCGLALAAMILILWGAA